MLFIPILIFPNSQSKCLTPKRGKNIYILFLVSFAALITHFFILSNAMSHTAFQRLSVGGGGGGGDGDDDDDI